jgi:NAD(P)-dependent dehydrogenase (short-subunit alcohol dehydrogenase family)
VAEERRRTVLVTGGAGGIGRAVGEVFAAHGERVIALDVDEDGLAELGPGIEPMVVDITDAEAVDMAFAQIGPVDVVIHSAGTTSLGPFADTPQEAVDRVFELNVRAAILVTRAALPGLRQRQGRIGVLSSVAGFAPLLYRTAYSASKHALHGFFESLRAELVHEGVSITLICPSFVATGIDRRAVHHSAGEAGSWTTTGEVLAPDVLAQRVRTGVMARRRLVLPSRTARAAFLVSRIAPGAYERTMRRRIRRT